MKCLYKPTYVPLEQMPCPLVKVPLGKNLRLDKQNHQINKSSLLAWGSAPVWIALHIADTRLCSEFLI